SSSGAACCTWTGPPCAPGILVLMRSPSTNGSPWLPSMRLSRSEAGVKAAKRRGGTTRAALTPRPSDGYLVPSTASALACTAELLTSTPAARHHLRKWSKFPELGGQNFRTPQTVDGVSVGSGAAYAGDR